MSQISRGIVLDPAASADNAASAAACAARDQRRRRSRTASRGWRWCLRRAPECSRPSLLHARGIAWPLASRHARSSSQRSRRALGRRARTSTRQSPYAQPWSLSPPSPGPPASPKRSNRWCARVLAPNPSPFTFTGTQTYLVGDARADCAVIDPGPDEPEHIAALIAAIGGRTVVGDLLHPHPPRPFARRRAAGGADRRADRRLRAAGAAERRPALGCAVRSRPMRPTACWPTAKRCRGTGWTLTAVATPGHTSNHLCFALEESGALFTGDHVMGWSTSVVIPPDGDMADYMASLEKLYGARRPRLLPGPRRRGRQAPPAGARHDRPPPPAREPDPAPAGRDRAARQRLHPRYVQGPRPAPDRSRRDERDRPSDRSGKARRGARARARSGGWSDGALCTVCAGSGIP